MRVLALAAMACVLVANTSAASTQTSPADVEWMRMEALQNLAPDRLQGDTSYLLEDLDEDVDNTIAQGNVGPDDCSRVPIQAQRSDGMSVTKIVNVCD
jgi:hypothetical protein